MANVIITEVRRALQNSKSKSLLDYGSGTGLVSLALSDLVDTVLLVDASENMLEVAEAKISQMRLTNARALYSDFTHDTPDLKADIALMSLVLLHIPDTKKILQELFEVLPIGGQLMIVDFDKNDTISHPTVHNGFSHDEQRKSLTDVGFTFIDMKTFHHGQRIFMNQDASMFIANCFK
ncbi:ubiquinone/menaquinone biosynthesis C-methylase UbiE [Sporosarcina luteola]|nr:ubiquinone/menaquinone biosynthesis C-methylase UbiE [Sporosarcina luteola]